MPPTEHSFSRAYGIATRRPVAVLMVFIAVVVFGAISYQRLAINLMPDISYPSITVRTEYPGTAPEEVENAISIPLEQALGVVDGLVTISSVSQAGLSDIIIEYRWDTDMDQAIQEVREKIDQVFLPEQAQRPLILRYDPTLDPVVRLGLHGGANLFTLRYFADEDIKRALEKIPGVAAVRVKGGYEEEIRINVSEHQLVALGLSLEEVSQRLFQENINIAGGNLKEGDTEYVVRTLNEFSGLDDIANLVITHKNGVPIYLRDFAEVQSTFKDREVLTRVNGEESVEIALYKEADANLVAVARNIRNAVFGTPQERARWQEYQQRKAAPSADKTASTQTQSRRGGAQAASPLFMIPTYLEAALPAGMRIELLSDQSTFVESSIRDVRDTAILGGILAVIVLYFFLRNLATTLIIGVSIPISVIATFAPMNLAHVTLNIMSLGGLALGIGMLVDNSIVVLESIFRCREEGDPLLQAAVRGVSEVGGAVIASTLTTVAVFFPIVFVEGVAGQVFGDMALTVVFSLLASLAAAVFLIPMLASRRFSLFKTPADSGDARGFFPRYLAFSFWRRLRGGVAAAWRWWRRGRLAGRLLKALPLLVAIMYLTVRGITELLLNLIQKIFLLCLAALALIFRYAGKALTIALKPVTTVLLSWFDTGYRKLAAAYLRLLEWSLVNPGRVLTGAVLLFLLSFLLLLPRLGRELIPEVHQGEFAVEMTFPVGTPVETTAQRSFALEQKAGGLPDVERVSLTAGVEKNAFSSAEEGEHTSRITLRLRPGGDLARKEARVIDLIRNDLRDIPEVETKISHPTIFSIRTPVEVEVRGYNLADLGKVAAQVEQRLAAIPGIVDVKSNFAVGNPEIRVNYDRERVAAVGLNVHRIASLVRNKVLGDVATEFRQGDRRIDVRVRIREQDRTSLEDLKRLVINPGGSQPIPLAAVAEVTQDRGPARIWRVDQQRSARISANVAGRDLGGAVRELKENLADLQIPDNISLVLSGQNREMEQSLNSLTFALLLAIFLVYIVMASQFESLLHPFVILFTIPLAGIGVIFVLFALNIPLSIVVYLGMIMLAGIVVNNAIVLVDYINQLRRRGLHLKAAVVQAARVRLRPILMTTATTVLGLIPMSLGLGEGAEIRTPMAITVIAGLISSTLLTLIVIPVVYTLVNRDQPETSP
jgi:HAE1 family hydrophobic/amphiphilic exporter-1